MTPKERAEEIVERFSEMEDNNNSFDYDRKCALVCVDQIINSYNWSLSDLNYWQEVKLEIKLK